MSAGVCFFREKSWEQDQWSYVFSNFGIVDIWEMGDVSNKDLEIYQTSTKISTAEELPKRPLVVLAPQEGKYIQGTESLINFKHPKDAIYLFGASHLNLNTENLGNRFPTHLVYIPLNKCECYSHAAAYMVLWDRRVKKYLNG